MPTKVNGTKQLTDLTAVTAINDADVLLLQTTSGFRKITGANLKSVIKNSITVPDIDATLSTTGQAADAKATGDAIQATKPTTETVTGTDPVITAEDNHMYVCGEVTSLDFTPCATGICDVRFTSGSTLTVLTLPSTVSMPDGFVVEANRKYELNFLDGMGVYQSWQIAST